MLSGSQMSTLGEIEAAIEHLPARQVEELAAWLDQRRSVRGVEPRSAEAWLERARGAAAPGMTTDAVMALTREKIVHPVNRDGWLRRLAGLRARTRSSGASFRS